MLDAPATCTGCDRHQPLIGIAEDGTGICGAYSGTAFDYICRTCGLGGRTYADAQCAHRVLTARLQQLLARGILHWLKHSPNAALFASLAASGEPITHQRLDQLPPSRHLHYVRHTLVHLGALSKHEEELDRIPTWLDTVLADRPAGHVQMVRPHAHWHLLRRARRRAAQRRRPAEPGSFLRTTALPLGLVLNALVLFNTRYMDAAQIGAADAEEAVVEFTIPDRLRKVVDHAGRLHRSQPGQFSVHLSEGQSARPPLTQHQPTALPTQPLTRPDSETLSE
ncbi:hypothetical protein [Streptomyces chartreusis]